MPNLASLWPPDCPCAPHTLAMCISHRTNAQYMIQNPTGRFTILEPQDREIGDIYVVQKRRTTDFEAPKL